MSQDSRYVTVKECLANITTIKEDLEVIKRALCGEDMRGGLIRDVGQLYGKISEFSTAVGTIKCELENDKANRKENRKMIAGVAGALVTAAVSILVAIFK